MSFSDRTLARTDFFCFYFVSFAPGALYSSRGALFICRCQNLPGPHLCCVSSWEFLKLDTDSALLPVLRIYCIVLSTLFCYSPSNAILQGVAKATARAGARCPQSGASPKGWSPGVLVELEPEYTFRHAMGMSSSIGAFCATTNMQPIRSHGSNCFLSLRKVPQHVEVWSKQVHGTFTRCEDFSGSSIAFLPAVCSISCNCI